MKKVSKITGFFILVLSLLVSMAGVVFAATSHTTGLKDNLYLAQTTPDAQNSSYKMNVNVEGGKVTYFEFACYNGTTKFQSAFLAAIPDQAAKDKVQRILDETAYYTAQMAIVGDAMRVTKYSKAPDNEIYTSFQTLWKDVVKQAGGQIVEDTTATSTATISNPKTGDNGVLVYVILAGAALVSMAVLSKKRLTA